MYKVIQRHGRYWTVRPGPGPTYYIDSDKGHGLGPFVTPAHSPQDMIDIIVQYADWA